MLVHKFLYRSPLTYLKEVQVVAIITLIIKAEVTRGVFGKQELFGSSNLTEEHGQSLEMREFFRNFPALNGDVSVAAVGDFLVDTIVIGFDDFNCLFTVVDFAYSLLEELTL